MHTHISRFLIHSATKEKRNTLKSGCAIVKKYTLVSFACEKICDIILAMKNKHLTTKCRQSFCSPIATGGILLLYVLIFGFLLSGCKSGSSDSSDTGVFEAVLVPGKLANQGSGDQDILYASIRGSNISGGWIEDPQGAVIQSSNMVFENAVNKYEVILARNTGGFAPGDYTLKYTKGGETLEYKAQNLSWTIAPAFTSAPNMTWNNFTRTLTITNISLAGSAQKFYLRLYNGDTGYLRYETYDTSSTTITEYISQTGNYQVVLMGDVYESGSIKFKAIFIFQTQYLAGI